MKTQFCIQMYSFARKLFKTSRHMFCNKNNIISQHFTSTIDTYKYFFGSFMNYEYGFKRLRVFKKNCKYAFVVFKVYKQQTLFNKQTIQPKLKP